MTDVVCGAAQVLRGGGPVAVPFQACCAAVLIRAGADASAAPDFPCTITVPVDAGSLLGGADAPIAVGEP
jgi:hypothetical protein